jgi:hypothetical protein
VQELKGAPLPEYLRPDESELLAVIEEDPNNGFAVKMCELQPTEQNNNQWVHDLSCLIAVSALY